MDIENRSSASNLDKINHEYPSRSDLPSSEKKIFYASGNPTRWVPLPGSLPDGAAGIHPAPSDHLGRLGEALTGC
jgi:hypothetical protein